MKLKLVIFTLILGSYLLYLHRGNAVVDQSLSHVKNLYATGIAQAQAIQNQQ